MGYSKILVGYDCSDASNRALADAYELVDHGLADGVVVVTVTDLAKTGDPAFNAAARAAGVLLTSIGDEEEALSNLKKNIGERIAGHEGVTTLRVAFGKPHELIISIAKSERCGLIVMGSRGLGAPLDVGQRFDGGPSRVGNTRSRDEVTPSHMVVRESDICSAFRCQPSGCRAFYATGI